MANKNIEFGPAAGGAPADAYSTPEAALAYVDGSTGLLVVGSSKTAPTTASTYVDTASAQSLTNKTIVTPTITTVPVASGGGTSRQLTAAGSGTINLFDLATNFTYLLPAPPVIGQVFYFLWTVLETGGQAHIVTAGAGVFLNGAVQSFSGEDVTPSATLGPKQYSGNGTTHIKTTCNGTTLGGGIGQWLCFRAISATIWNVTGTIVSPSGTLATPFST
jgi:hypothetical protein